MSFLYSPLDEAVVSYWSKVDRSTKNAFLFVIGVSLLAFGFEMTNLTLHHDDVIHIFIQDTILGYYLGRFGFGWMHYYLQSGYIMPFLQMVEGILLMGAYGLLIARLWGLRRTWDVALIAGIVCVFPYVAQIYQYNTSMAASPMAHFLVAAAVLLSIRGTILLGTVASLLYVAAFSIYQAVAANAATIFLFWLLCRLLFQEKDQPFLSKAILRGTIAALASVVVGGIVYLIAVSFMDIPYDSYQSAGKAFSLGDGLNFSYALTEIIKGTRSFFLWPENYFPNYLKKVQLVLIAGAAVICLWLPRGIGAKLAAVSILVLAGLSPRALQLLHAEGHYHSLTLTGYAVVIAGVVMIINRAGNTLARNASAVLTFFLIAGYVIQCNWISTVNYLNTLAHYSTLTQVLARVRSLPDPQWDGKTIAVVGKYEMPSDYPFKEGTGVATKFIDAKHLDKLAKLMRDEVTFVAADQTMPKVLEYAATHSPWPHPGSVSVVDGIGVIVFARN